MKLVFAGTPEVALPALDAFIASKHEVAAVLTRPDARAGRGRTLEESPVARRAAENGIEVLKPEKPSDPDFMARLRDIAPDCCPVVAYGAMLPPEVLDIPEFGWINLHFSVLPAWRGAAPVQRSIMSGDEVTGASVFRIVEKLDAGPVLGLLTERIRDSDTAGTLLGRLAEAGAGLIGDVIDHLETGDITAVPQAEDGVSYAHKLKAEDGHVDWTRPAFAINRQIRSCTPTPGAWTTHAGERFKLAPVEMTEESTLTPGIMAISKSEVRVGTATSDVILSEIQPPGKRLMNAADWGRGANLDARARFE